MSGLLWEAPGGVRAGEFSSASIDGSFFFTNVAGGVGGYAKGGGIDVSNFSTGTVMNTFLSGNSSLGGNGGNGGKGDEAIVGTHGRDG